MDASMKKPLITPTAELVKEACREFDDQNDLTENALDQLFKLFPENTVPSQVLLKVAALNQLYSTQILAVSEVAKHICANGSELDLALKSGVTTIVDRIAKVTIKEKVRNNFSFASKYCSWHQPDLFPIWDSRVDWYLRRLQRETKFCSSFGSADHWDYPAFHSVMVCLRTTYNLEAFTFKQIDKFLYKYGELATVSEA